MLERRKHQRRRSYLGARLIFGNRYLAIDCLIRDISPAGARIVLPRVDIIPECFDLFLTERRRTIRSRRIWNDPGDLGIVFLEEGDHLVQTTAEEEQIRRLAAENAALKARLDSLI